MTSEKFPLEALSKIIVCVVKLIRSKAATQTKVSAVCAFNAPRGPQCAPLLVEAFRYPTFPFPLATVFPPFSILHLFRFA